MKLIFIKKKDIPDSSFVQATNFKSIKSRTTPPRIDLLYLRLSLRARQGVAIQSDALRGMPRRCGGLPDGSAGLPRRYAPRNDNGGNLRSGFACLAWPCSASDSRSALQGQHRKLRRSVRLRSLPAQAPLCSAAPYGLTPLLAGRSETEAEAQDVAAEGGHVPEPNRGTGVERRDEPGTTA